MKRQDRVNARVRAVLKRVHGTCGMVSFDLTRCTGLVASWVGTLQGYIEGDMEEAEKTEWLKNFDAPCRAESEAPLFYKQQDI